MTTRFGGFLQNAKMSVDAQDACHVIRDQIEVCRLAVAGLSDGHDDDACNAVCSLLHDVAEAVSALSEAARLNAAVAA
jgi:hypothetical protein